MSVKDKECGCCKYYIGDRKVEYSIFLNFYSMTYKGRELVFVSLNSQED